MRRVAFVLVALILSISVIAQVHNPADKYTDAYKQYEDASCPLPENGIKHFVYFARDRDKIHDHSFLNVERIDGAQIMYSWRELEPQRGIYDFSSIREDYQYLVSNKKKLFIQLQDVSFSASYKAVPDYLLSEEFDGGCVALQDEEGWLVKRWNPNVQRRWALLLHAIGEEFDGKIEGINLQESAVDLDGSPDISCTPERYTECIQENMLALKQAFPKSVTMQYANFMPGEWLPWNDQGYLRSIYQYGQEIGVGLGGPDLMVRRKGQLNHLIAVMHEGDYTVPLGIAIQDGNYVGKTGADKDYMENDDSTMNKRKNLVPLLHAFASDFMKVDYIFWTIQEPYFSQDLLPCLDTTN